MQQGKDSAGECSIAAADAMMSVEIAPAPRLVLKVIDVPTAPSGKVLALCTEDGKVFGAQIACTVHGEAESFTEVTVRLIVDGDAVRFAD